MARKRSWLALVMVIATIAGAIGAGGAAFAGPVPVHGSGSPTGSDYAAFLDALIPAQLARYRIPGAAVVVVDGGKQVYARGYGLADVDAGRAVSPDSTGFFIASTTKLWTATAVMQLVEQGKLDLHADVNRYLTTFKIRDTYPGQPVTLANLLTHTAGFSDRVLGAAVRDAADVQPLAEYMAEHQPDRIRPPGLLASYDNYGFTLAGYIVQAVSGEPFDKYVAAHILRPLGMSGATAAQPHPAAVNTTLAQGYRPTGDQQVAEKGQYGPMAPAGAGVVATATDMGRFLSAQLRDATPGGNGPHLLGPAAAAQLQAQQFTDDPRLPGMALAWEEHSRDGHRILTKDGDVPGFHSNTAILPDQGIGIFVVYNGDGLDGNAAWADKQLVEQFVDHFDPGSAAHVAPAADAAPSVEQYAGSYRVTRTAPDLTKAAALTSSVSVHAGPDGTLTTHGPLSADPDKTTQHWTLIGPNLFQERDGQDQLAFRVDGQGHVTTLLSTANPTMAYLRLAWWQSPTLHQILLAVSFIVLFLTLLYWPLATLIRRLRHRPATATTGTTWARAARLTAWICAAAVTAFIGGLVVLFADANALNETVMLGGSAWVRTVLALSTGALALTAASVVATVTAWRRGWWTRAGRLHYTVVTLAAITFLGIVASYHLTIA